MKSAKAIFSVVLFILIVFFGIFDSIDGFMINPFTINFQNESSKPITSVVNKHGNFESITVATFNIQTFGKSKLGKPKVMHKLGEIGASFDIMGVQELRDATNTVPLAYLDEILDSSNKSFRVTYSDRLGRSTSKEQYAFYFNEDKVELLGQPYVFDDINDVFEREPFIAYFKSNNHSFTLINVHIKPSDAFAEIKALDVVIKDAISQFNDSDVIVLGDLNADCSYFDENKRNDVLDYNWMVPVDVKTNLAVKSDCTYDNFVATNDANEEISNVQVHLFNFSEPNLISDHYPVFLSLDVS